MTTAASTPDSDHCESSSESGLMKNSKTSTFLPKNLLQDNGTDWTSNNNNTIPQLSLSPLLGDESMIGVKGTRQEKQLDGTNEISPRFDPPYAEESMKKANSPIGNHITKSSPKLDLHSNFSMGLAGGSFNNFVSSSSNTPPKTTSLFATVQNDQFLRSPFSSLHSSPVVSPTGSPKDGFDEDELESLNRSISNTILNDDGEDDNISPADSMATSTMHNGDSTWNEDFINGMGGIDDLHSEFNGMSSTHFSSFDTLSSGSASPQSLFANGAQPNGAFVEHPLGEHPSRTLFVRNISSHVDDIELRDIFEAHGAIRSMYTQCKHRGFVMISYYDIRHAKNAMKHLQHKIIKRRKIDIHYSIPKENPSEKDLNQGTLVVFNLDSSITNDELAQLFGAFGEIKEIRETPNKKHHKFIEFFDVRDADKAMKGLNKTELRGKKIKIEPSRPGGARRSLMNSWQYDSLYGPCSGTSTSPDPFTSSSPQQLSLDDPPINLLSHQQILNDNINMFSPPATHQKVSNPSTSTTPSVGGVMNQGLGTGIGNQHLMNGFMGTGHFSQQQFMQSQQMNHQMLLQQQQMLNQLYQPFAHPQFHHQWGNMPLLQSNNHQQQGAYPANVDQHSIRLVSPRVIENSSETTPQVVLSHQRNDNMKDNIMYNSNSNSNTNNSSNNGYVNNNSNNANNNSNGMHNYGGNNGYNTNTYNSNANVNNGNGYTNANGNNLNTFNYNNVVGKSRSHSSASTNAAHAPPVGMHDRMRSRNRAMSAEDRKKFFLDIEKVRYGIDKRTTLMVKNIPNKYTQKMLLQTIDIDFNLKYDFFYLPIDFKNKCNVGYAFINFSDPLTIIPFYQAFHGKKWEKFNSEKVCDITYARIQGKQALMNHFQNSSLMCEDPSCRPLFKQDGSSVYEH